jgi:hypothetical protein
LDENTDVTGIPLNNTESPSHETIGDLIKEAVGDITGGDIQNKPFTQVVNEFDVKSRAAELEALQETDESVRGLIMPGNDLTKGRSAALNNYEVRQSIIWVNLIWRIGEVLLERATFNSPFQRFIKQMPVGGDIQEIFINYKPGLFRSTLQNSDLFTDFIDDVKTAYHRMNWDKVFPTTYRDDHGRLVFHDWDTLTNFITAVVANLQLRYQVDFNEANKQSLTNLIMTGQIESIVTPRITDNEGNTIEQGLSDYVVRLLTISDDFMTEPSPRNIGANLSTNTTSPVLNICPQIPLILLFNDELRMTELYKALELHFGMNFLSGNSNQDFMRNIIRLNKLDWPLDVVPLSPVFAQDPQAEAITNGYANAPTSINWNEYREDGGFFSNLIPSAYRNSIGVDMTRLRAIIIDPEALILRKKFDIQLTFQNIITLAITQAFHTDMTISFSPFKKAVAIFEEHTE